MSDRTQRLQTGVSGCIEDRTFLGAEKGELNQVPGADIFFSFAADIINSANGTEVPHTLRQAVITDVESLGPAYVVHNDADHGGEFDGCGFAAKIDVMSKDLVENFDEVFGGSKLADEFLERSKQLVDGLDRIATGNYFEIIGGKLVEQAVEAGASLITYIGEHSAAQLTDDEQEDSSYDSATANNPQTDSKPAFNLDSNHARDRAQTFGIDQTDSYILAKLLATSTVRVLSDGAIKEVEVL